MNPVSRFDMPESFKTMLEQCINLGIIDVFDVYELATSFGNDFRAITSELCLIASYNGKTAHALVVKAAENVWSDKTLQGQYHLEP